MFKVAASRGFDGASGRKARDMKPRGSGVLKYRGRFGMAEISINAGLPRPMPSSDAEDPCPRREPEYNAYTKNALRSLIQICF